MCKRDKEKEGERERGSERDYVLQVTCVRYMYLHSTREENQREVESGVPPPSSVKIVTMNISRLLNKI